MLILSIDVGIRNLAMCLIDESDKSIKHWDVSSVPSETDDGLFCALNEHLRDRPWTLDADVVLIEKQPDRNRRIVSCMYFLQSYFIILAKEGARTFLWNAALKVPDCQGKTAAAYRKRKNTAIERCRTFLENTWSVNGKWIEFFDTHRKKDDLADTVLQALSYENAPRAAAAAQKVSVVRPRRPTEHQKKTRYSKSNLVFVYNHFVNTPEFEKNVKQNKRFNRDVARYYKDFTTFELSLQERSNTM